MKNKYYPLCCSALPQPTADYLTYSMFNMSVIYIKHSKHFAAHVLSEKESDDMSNFLREPD